MQSTLGNMSKKQVSKLAELTFQNNRTGYLENPIAELSKLRAWLELSSMPGKISILLPISARASSHLQGKN